MKEMIRFVLAGSLVLVGACLAGTYGGGSGTVEDAFQIWNAEQLNEFGASPQDYDKHFILMGDIDLSSYVYSGALISPDTDPNVWGPQGAYFAGSLDGNGHTISNLTINAPDTDNVALIGHLKPGSSIRNLTLKKISITGRACVAGLAANCKADIRNCQVEGVIRGSFYVAGLVSFNDGAIIDKCRAQTALFITQKSQGQVGGLCSFNNKGTITNSQSVCAITLPIAFDYIGGFVAGNLNGTIERCWSMARISSEQPCKYIGGFCAVNNGEIHECYALNTSIKAPKADSVGGFAGINSSSIMRSFAEGIITGGDNCGGIIGTNSGYIADTYSTVYVRSNITAGGFSGLNEYGIARSYSIGKVESGSNIIGGFIGKNDGIAYLCYWDAERSGVGVGDGGIGITTAQLMNMASFLGWGDEAWVLSAQQDYPRLAWQQKPGEKIQDSPAVYGGGDGTADNPFLINTIEQLAEIGQYPQDLSKSFRLMGDLDFQNTVFNGVGWGRGFEGTFDGAGYTIRNITLSTANYYSGLFPMILMRGVVKNLHVENAAMHGSARLGLLAGKNDGLIQNCTVQGKIDVSNAKPFICGAGGLVGMNSGAVLQCRVHSEIMVNNETSARTNRIAGIGGAVGSNLGRIMQCRSDGKISIEAGRFYRIGGLVGDGVYDSTIQDCVSFTDVICNTESCHGYGGLVGEQQLRTKIDRCLSAGKVVPYRKNYELFGNSPEAQQYRAFMEKNFPSKKLAPLEVNTLGVGGFIGSNGFRKGDGKIQSCFWDIQTSGLKKGDGANLTENIALTGLTTIELQNAEIYRQAGWDIGTDDKPGVWTIKDGNYPELTCFITTP